MAMIPRAYRRPLAEGKQRVQRKLRNIEEEKADIIKLINAYTAKVERVAKTLLHADRECFFSFYHAVNRELEECLDKLFLIKAQLLENEEAGEILKDSGLVLEEKDSSAGVGMGGVGGGSANDGRGGSGAIMVGRDLPQYLADEEGVSRCSSISKLCQSITSSMMLHESGSTSANKDFAGQSTSERNLNPHNGSSRSDAAVTKGPYPTSHAASGARSNSMMDAEPFELTHVLHKWQNCDLQQNGGSVGGSVGVRRSSKAYSDGEDSRSETRHTGHVQRQQPPSGMSSASLEAASSRVAAGAGAPHSSTCSPAESARHLSEFLEFGGGRGPSSLPIHPTHVSAKLSERHLEEACLVAHKSQDIIREMQFWPKKDPLDALAENHLPPPPPAPSETQNIASWISPPWVSSGMRSREHTPPAVKLAEIKQQNHASLSRASPRCSPVREIPDHQAVLSGCLPPPPPQRTYHHHPHHHHHQEMCPPEEFGPAVPPVDYSAFTDHYSSTSVVPQPPPPPVVYEIPPPVLELGMITPVTVTHIIKPSDFWLRVLSEEGKSLSEQLQLAYNSRHSRENLQVEVGLYYCAPYGKDNIWHRVKVLGIHPPESQGGVADVHVLFVDYGNTDMIPITHLKSLDMTFTTWPLQAVHCCLNGIGEEKQTWTSYEMAQFQQVATSTQLSAVFHEPRSDGIYPVDLLSNISYGDEILTVSIVSYLVSSHSSVAPPPGLENVPTSPETLPKQPDEKPAPEHPHSHPHTRPEQGPEVLSRSVPEKDDSSDDDNLEYYSDTSDTYVELNDYNAIVPPPVVSTDSDGYILCVVCSMMDPSEMYAHLITPNSNQLDDLQEQMSNYYNAATAETSRDVAFTFSALQRGSFWACRYSADNNWYRARVVDMLEDNKSGKVLIQYIDFGNKEEVAVKDLKPLTPEFAKLPAFAFRCSLAHLKPKSRDDGTDHSVAGNWSQQVIDRLSQLIDYERCVTAQPISDISDCDLWESGIEILLWDTEDQKDILLNKVLVREGLCDTDKSEWLFEANEEESSTATTATVSTSTKDGVAENGDHVNDDCDNDADEDNDDEDDDKTKDTEVSTSSASSGLFGKSDATKFPLKDRLSPLTDVHALLEPWNPMEDDYSSERNCYAVDTDDPSVAVLGYRVKEDSNICYHYSTRMSCPKGDNCPFLHVFTGNGVAVAAEDEYVVETAPKLPKPGGLFLVKVTSVIDPGHFYVIFPYGLVHVEDLFRGEDSSHPAPAKEQVELKKLLHNMGKHFSKMSSRENPAILPGMGSIVAAKTAADSHWFRGKVIDFDDTVPGFNIKVFCVDTGKIYWIPRKDVFKIQPEYLHVPFQAVECFLANVEPKGSETGARWTKEAKETFQDMVLGKGMVARILKRDLDALYIDLLDVEEKQEFAVSGHLVTMGFAQFSRAMICIPPPSEESKEDDGDDDEEGDETEK